MNTKAKLLLIKLRLNVIIAHYFCNFFFIIIKVSLPNSCLLLVALSPLFAFQICAVIALEDLG